MLETEFELSMLKEDVKNLTERVNLLSKFCNDCFALVKIQGKQFESTDKEIDILSKMIQLLKTRIDGEK